MRHSQNVALKTMISDGKGTYTLVIRVEKRLALRVGSLKTLTFTRGWYAYTGSALGPQGLAGRIERHLKKRKRSFWHIDYLLESPHSTISAVVYAKTEEKLECEVIDAVRDALQARPIEDFGSSDCRRGCEGHLLFITKRHFDSALGGIVEAYRALDLLPFTLILEKL